MSLVLPQSTLNLLNSVPVASRHPGLQLDKFSEPGDQTVQKRALTDVVGTSESTLPHARDYSQLRDCWLAAMRSVKAEVLRAVTTGPLTLHLARASALENVGICLHPLYGFTYLPGSGLKGMARAYAETVWLPAQPDQKQAWRQIEEVFGWSPGSDRRKDWKPSGIAERAKDDNAHVGDIVFHDAWPETWPELVVDIVNNHHPDYYQHDDNQHAPGDWEDPKPVYFLAVKPEATFTFPLAKRRANVADDSLELARQWLLGALCHLGAGAKTNAGYGCFKPVEGEPSKLQSPARAAFKTTLELVTPAFLAGAGQQADDCDLRPATLRGQLRWWWRTIHAGFLDVKTLRALEAAIWGNTKSGGAVRIVVEKADGNQPQPYDKRSMASFNDQQKVSDLGIPNGDARKTTQGLWYASYGMDEGGQNNRRQRYVLEPKTPVSWRIRLIARHSRLDSNGRELTAWQVLEQAQAALWLLCQFGGVGSKAGKGFGSLSAANLSSLSLNQVKLCGSELRQALNLNNSFVDSAASSAALEQMLGPVETTFAWPSIWSVLDQIGFAYSRGARNFAHNAAKVALGLPRQIHGPRNQPLPHQDATTHRRPQRLRGPQGDRHTSPVRIHVERTDDGFLVRAIAFPAEKLPNLADSRKFLEEFLRDFNGDMQRRAKLQPLPVPSNDGGGGGRRMPQPQPPPSRPQPGQRVEATLLEEKTRKGGWKAKHEPSGLSGPVQNTGDVPADKNAGDKVTLIVASSNEREIAFRFPTAADEQRADKSQGKPRGGHGGQRPRRRG